MVWAQKLSRESEKSFDNCMREAERFTYQHAGLAHLLAGLMDTEYNGLMDPKNTRFVALLDELGVDKKEFTRGVEGKIRKHYQESELPEKFQLSVALISLMDAAEKYAEASGEEQIRPEHLFYAATQVSAEQAVPLKPEESSVGEVLRQYNLTPTRVDEAHKAVLKK